MIGKDIFYIVLDIILIIIAVIIFYAAQKIKEKIDFQRQWNKLTKK